MSARTYSRTQPMGALEVALALAGLIVASVLLAWLYPRAFPLRAVDWQLQRGEAIELARAAALDLGELPQRAYISATLATQEALELRLLRSLRAREGDAGEVLRGERQMLQVWRVTIFAAGAPVDQWAYVAEISLSGKLLTLLKGTEADFSSSVELPREDAIRRAGEFLELQGVDAEELVGPPTLRRIELDGFTYTLVRYTARGVEFDWGIEVRFAGDTLRGMRSWVGDPDDVADASIAEALRGSTLAQTFRLVVVFLFVPFVAVFFVRRYHRGEVGVRNGVRVFYLVLGAAALLLLLVVRGAADGSSMSNVSREQMTWLVTTLMLVVYFPALGALALMGTALGDSAARGGWRRRLAAFDALLSLQWTNSTVAASSLRGVVGGAVLATLLLSLAAALPRVGVEVPFAFTLGPWWPSAPWPGLALVLAMLIYSLIYCCFGLLLLVPPAIDRLGPGVGVVSVAVFASLIFFPPLNVVPVLAGLPIAFAAGCFAVGLYVRFDLLVALLTSLVSATILGALPLLHATDPWLELQGWGALALVAAPVLVSFRALQRGQPYPYSHDDVPEHVRRIAERERQRVELETAREIQSSILPQLPSEMNGVELAHLYIPASEVGGDFYDVLSLSDSRLAVAVGDVAGHGVSSGLIMSMVRSALAVQVTFRPEVEAVLATLNKAVYETSRSGRRLLTTLCYLLLDPRSGELIWASAGHIYPYVVDSAGRLHCLESTAYPLGVRRELVVDVRRTSIQDGDVLFLCSDGLVEARRFGGMEPFGFDRLEESLVRCAGRSSREVLEAVHGDLLSFIGAPASAAPAGDDDLTILVLRLGGC